MSNIQIKLVDIQKMPTVTNTLASSQGFGSNKWLRVVVDVISKKILYQVENHNKVVEYTNLASAVDFYNTCK